MGRKVKDSTMDSKDARRKLAVRHAPYYRQMERGLHLGYRRLKGKAGTWVARHYVGSQAYEVETLGIADDQSDADGIKILDYWQAQEKARASMATRTKTGEGTTAAALTVGEAVTDYVAERNARDTKRKGRPVRSDAGQRLRRYVLGQPTRGEQPEIEAAPLAKVQLHALDDDDLKSWRKELPDTLAAGTRQRLINDLKAALNSAYEDNRRRLPVTLPATIKYGLKAEKRDAEDAPVPDSQVLTDTEITRLLRAAQEIDTEQEWDGDLYRLIVVMAATGARFSQVARLRVRDCQIENCRIMMPDSLKGQNKTVDVKPIPVSRDVINTLRPVMNRKATAPLLERWRHKQVSGSKWERTGRGPWSKGEETRPWQAIRERAGLPEATAYCLRHSSIVRDYRLGLPGVLIASKHDTSEAIIQRHYARFVVGDLEKLLASKVVSLVPQDKGGKVLTIGGR